MTIGELSLVKTMGWDLTAAVVILGNHLESANVCTLETLKSAHVALGVPSRGAAELSQLSGADLGRDLGSH